MQLLLCVSRPHYIIDGVTEELIDDLQELKDWYLFGEVVGVPQAQLMAIQIDSRMTEECKRLMLERWIRLERPSWPKIISSLFKCGLAHLGWQLAEKHGKV